MPALSVYGLADIEGVQAATTMDLSTLMRLPLAKVSETLIDYLALIPRAKLLDPLLAELIETTQSLPAFLRLIDPSPGKAAAKVSQLPWRASRLSGALEGMKQVGILQPCPKSSLKACAVDSSRY
jgi:hypothetical protein